MRRPKFNHRPEFVNPDFAEIAKLLENKIFVASEVDINRSCSLWIAAEEQLGG